MGELDALYYLPSDLDVGSDLMLWDGTNLML